MIPRVLKNFILSVDGVGFAGVADEVILPKLTLKTEEHLAGGLDTPVDIELGTEKLTLEFTLSEFNEQALSLWGLGENKLKAMTLRGSLENDSDARALLIQMRGLVTEIDPGTVKAQEKTQCKFTVGLRYYRFSINDADLIEIDVDNFVRKIKGEDQLATRRQHLGL